MATASFLGLPAEVRLLIYELIFVDREVALIDDRAVVRHSNDQILRTCHQINREADPILHRTSLYIFGSPDSLIKMANRNPSAFFYHLRYVKLDLWSSSHGNIDYRGFCHLNLSQWGTALGLLYLRPGRQLKHLMVVCKGPAYAKGVPPAMRNYIEPWTIQYSGIKNTIIGMVKAERMDFSDDIKQRDSISTSRSAEYLAVFGTFEALHDGD
ncbi:MAG: hypothetical protein M1830_005544 [Pleopsidium flavum]|nr:MAG: hypothetical protein M1830_005544 [Pleopsidium flavum]